MGIAIELLVVVKTDDKGTSSTWIHPKLGIQFALWCDPIFALQVSDWIEELLTTGKVELIATEKPRLKLVSKKLTVKQFMSTCKLFLDFIPDLDINRKATMVFSAAREAYPECAQIAAMAQAALPPAAPVEQSYTPTELGLMLTPTVSAQRVNSLLESANLQVSYLTARQQKKWKPTTSGQLHSVLTIEAKHNGAPVESIRWKVSVVELLMVRAVAQLV